MKFTWLIIAALAVCTAIASTAECIAKRQRSTQSAASESIPAGIAWYGVLTDGIADAKATNRPILMLSAAPQCAGVPGMW